MTVKIEAWQRRGIKTNFCVETFEFCCWEKLFRWLYHFQKLNACPDCSQKREGCGSEKEKGLLVRSHEVSVPSKAQEPEKLQKVKVEMTMQTFNIITGCLAQLGLDGGKLLRIGCEKGKKENPVIFVGDDKGMLEKANHHSPSQEPKVLTKVEKSVNKEKVINVNVKNGCGSEKEKGAGK